MESEDFSHSKKCKCILYGMVVHEELGMIEELSKHNQNARSLDIHAMALDKMIDILQDSCKVNVSTVKPSIAMMRGLADSEDWMGVWKTVKKIDDDINRILSRCD